MSTVTSTTGRIWPAPVAAAGFIVALVVGLALGWQIGSHQAAGRPEQSAEPAPLPLVQGPSAVTAAPDVAPPTLPEAPGMTDGNDKVAPDAIITVYLVATRADADTLQRLLDEASNLARTSDGSDWILVAGSEPDAIQAGAAVDTARARYGADRVRVIDLRSLVMQT